tara:strand:+ start:145 stop:555 length:411 start_codon:yes stop_codon:yes gene_type:complete
MKKTFNYNLKIYYEDTDSGGVVYYANYLKFFERARSEAIYSLKLSNKILLNQYGILIIVKSCNIKYIRPAKLEDKLTIKSKVKSITKTSFIMNQVIHREKQLITEADTHLVSVDQSGKPKKIPEILNKKLKKILVS